MLMYTMSKMLKNKNNQRIRKGSTVSYLGTLFREDWVKKHFKEPNPIICVSVTKVMMATYEATVFSPVDNTNEVVKLSDLSLLPLSVLNNNGYGLSLWLLLRLLL